MTIDSASPRGRFGLRKAARVAAWGLLLVVVGTLMGWSAASVLRSPTEALVSSPFTYAKVIQGEISSSITLNARASWTAVSIGTNQAIGVVTGVLVEPGQEVRTGTPVYSVNLRPVVVAAGSVPAFRSISRGADGADVAQLQRMLIALGYLVGQPDGTAGGATDRAIRSWQKSLQLEPTGVVEVGAVIFVPELPIRVSLNDKLITRGASLVGGEDAVQGLPAAPVFSISVSEGQAASIPPGTPVVVEVVAGTPWEGRVGGREPGVEQGTVVLTIDGRDGGAVCALDCTAIPLAGATGVSAQIIVLEPIDGLVVPSAALISGQDGELAVIDKSGKRHPIEVIATGRGMSVISGVSAGVRVRLPGEPG